MWLLPSRRRPQNLVRFAEACRMAGTATPGVIIVDRGDWGDNRGAYEAIELPLGWHFRVTEGETQGDKVREVWPEVARSHWLGLLGDDCVPETPGWDREMLSHLARALIVSCDDGWQAPRRLANCWVMAGELVQKLGYVFPPGLQHLFVDDVWEHIGIGAECWHCAMDVRVRHLHVMRGEAPADETHRAAYGEGFTREHPGPDRDGGLWAGDEGAFRRWRQDDEAAAIAIAQALRPAPPLQEPGDAHPEAWSLDRARSRSVLICTPMRDRPAAEYTIALANTQSLLFKLKIRHECRFVVGSSNPARVRNQLAMEFLASGYSDLLFIDDDMGWRPDAVVRLLASEHDLIGAVGRKKVDKPNSDGNVWCVRWLPPPFEQVGGAIAVEGVGTGFLRIARSVFETWIDRVPSLTRKGELVRGREDYYRFFYWGDDGASELSEDFQFCKDWRAMGGSVWIDPKIRLSHVGAKAFEGSVEEILMPLRG